MKTNVIGSVASAKIEAKSSAAVLYDNSVSPSPNSFKIGNASTVNESIRHSFGNGSLDFASDALTNKSWCVEKRLIILRVAATAGSKYESAGTTPTPTSSIRPCSSYDNNINKDAKSSTPPSWLKYTFSVISFSP